MYLIIVLETALSLGIVQEPINNLQPGLTFPDKEAIGRQVGIEQGIAGGSIIGNGPCGAVTKHSNAGTTVIDNILISAVFVHVIYQWSSTKNR